MLDKTGKLNSRLNPCKQWADTGRVDIPFCLDEPKQLQNVLG
jgi:hypothetical protein